MTLLPGTTQIRWLSSLRSDLTIKTKYNHIGTGPFAQKTNKNLRGNFMLLNLYTK